MRALWLAGTFHPQAGGVPVYVDRLTDALADVCDVAVVTEPSHARPSPRCAHFTVAGLTTPGSAAEWARAGEELHEVLERFEPDVVHFSTAGAAVYRAWLPEDVRTVATVHGNDLTAPWQRTPGEDARRVIVEQLDRCDRVFAVSTYTAGLLQQGGVRAPVTVVTAGCDLDLFRPAPHTAAATRARYGLPLDLPLVLTVARLAPRKGHLRVLAALERLAVSAHWAVVGSGPERDTLLRAVEASGLRGRVTLLEHVPTAELPLLYNACDLFVLTPELRHRAGLVDSEGFGLVYLEAAACAKPVVGSALAGCRDAVVDGSTGLLVPPGDTRALADAIERLLSDRRLARSFGRAGAAFVRASGGWSRLARETYDVYCELERPQRGPAAHPGVAGPL